MTEVIHKDWKRKFYIIKDGMKARLKYKIRRKEVLEILRTEVPEKWRGQGIGKKLTEAAMEYAKNFNYAVKPRCSFARLLLEKLNPENVKVIL